MYKNTLVIFDCDGVLVDSEHIGCRIEAAYLTECGYPISYEEDAQRFAGKPGEVIVAEVEKELGRALPADFEQQLALRVQQALTAEVTAMPHILPVLSGLPHKAVATNGTWFKVENSLRVAGLKPHFPDNAIFHVEKVKHGKPAPDIYLLAAKTMGFEPAHCVVVEDSVSGVTAGVAAGMHVIGFVGGTHILNKAQHAQKLKALGAAEILESFKNFNIH